MIRTRPFARTATIACLGLLSSCTDKDVSNGIAKVVTHLLAWMARILLISLGLMVAWAGLTAAGGSAIIAGFHRKRADPVSAVMVVVGCAVVVSAWPLTFTRLGIIATIDHHPPAIWSEGLLMQGLVALIIVVVGMVMSRASRPKAPSPVDRPPAPSPRAAPAETPASHPVRAKAGVPAARTAKKSGGAPTKSRS